ncbi:MAG: hypothetical protein ACKO0Z_21205, partial [Betaproteobacteria bacterium]
ADPLECPVGHATLIAMKITYEDEPLPSVLAEARMIEGECKAGDAVRTIVEFDGLLRRHNPHVASQVKCERCNEWITLGDHVNFCRHCGHEIDESRAKELLDNLFSAVANDGSPATRLDRLEDALRKCREIIDRAENGHCTICGGYRFNRVPGGRLVRGYEPCERSDCLSHELRELLGDGWRTMIHPDHRGYSRTTANPTQEFDRIEAMIAL